MKKFIFPLLICFICSIRVCADFENTGYGARQLGMGKSFVGLADDVYALVYNPAGLGNIKARQLSVNYRKLYWGLDDASELGEGFIAYVHPLTKKTGDPKKQSAGARRWGSVGIGFNNFRASSFYSENTFIASYGRNLEDIIARPLSLGLNLKILSKAYSSTPSTENAADSMGNTYGPDPVFASGYGKTAIGIDIGGYYLIGNGYSAGLVLGNINTPDTGLAETSRLPLDIKMGLCYGYETVNIVLDAQSRAKDIIVSPGFEKWVWDESMALRCGFRIGNRDIANAALGASYIYRNIFRFDYSFNIPVKGITGTYGSHAASLVVFFDKEPLHFSKAEESRKALANGHYSKGMEFFKTKKYGDAIEEWQKCLNIDPGFSGAATYIQKAKDKINETQKTEKREVNKTVIVKPEDEAKAEWYYSQALGKYDEGYLQKAIQDLERAINCNPGHKKAIAALERIRMEYNQLKK